MRSCVCSYVKYIFVLVCPYWLCYSEFSREELRFVDDYGMTFLYVPIEFVWISIAAIH